MKVVVITNDELKEELMTQGINEQAEIEWRNDIDAVPLGADALIDLLFDTHSSNRKEILQKASAEIIIVNDVVQTGEDLPEEILPE